MNILLFSSLFPNQYQPNKGIFVKNGTSALIQHCNTDVKVISPIPYFPPIRHFPRWYIFSQIPSEEIIEGIQVLHPRHFISPKVGMYLYGLWMFIGSAYAAVRLYKRWPFDLINGQYIYPDGFAAVLLAKLLKKPIVLSALGTDINVFPQLPLVRSLIKYTLMNADSIISVSSSLKDIMVDLGAPEKKIQVVPNGINPHRFYKIDKKKARRHICMEAPSKLLLAVGALRELKGFHLLIDAIHEIRSKKKLDFVTCILGGGEQYNELLSQIERYGLKDYVKLIGEVPHDDLKYWYNAADVFFLGSSREGWPNVVCEALACGLPVVATSAGAIPDIITSEEYGLLTDRNAHDFARTLTIAFQKKWNYEKIYNYGQSRTWETVAHEMNNIFSNTIDAFNS